MASKFELNDNTPAAPAGKVNVKWLSDAAGNVSGHVDIPSGGSGSVPASRQVIAGMGLTGGGDLSADVTLAVIPESTTQRVRVSLLGTSVATQPEISFIGSGNATVGLSDDAANKRVNVTIGAVGTYWVNTSPVAAREILNLIAGSNVTLSSAVQTNRVDVTISASGAAQSPWTGHINAAGYELRSVSKVGVGISSPGYAVDVSGDVNITGQFRVNGVPINTGVPPAVVSQTPWTQNIDAAGYELYNASKIGIGVAAPSMALHALSSGADTHLLCDVDSANAALLTLRRQGVGLWNIGLDSGDAYKLKFATGGLFNNLPAGTKLTIDTSGKVGIGTVSPSSAMEIVTSAAGPALKIRQTGNVTPSLEFIDSAVTPNSWLVGVGMGGPTDGAFGVYDSRQGLHRLVITPTGYTGIGIVGPVSKLTVCADGSGAIDATQCQLMLGGASNPAKRTMLGFDTANECGVMWSYEAGIGTRPFRFNPGGPVFLGYGSFTAAQMPNSTISFFAIEGGNQLGINVKYSNGVVKTATINLV